MSETNVIENNEKKEEEKKIENEDVIKIEEKKVEEVKVEKDDTNKLNEKNPEKINEDINKVKETKIINEKENDKDDEIHVIEIDSPSKKQEQKKINEKEKNEIKNEEIKKEEKNLQEINLETTKNKNIDLFIQKIQYYQKIYNFTQNYTNNLINIIKKFYEPLYKKIYNSYSNDIKPLIKFIGRLSYVYTGLNLEMKKINFDVEQTEKDNNFYLLGNDSSKIAHKTNILFDENFKNISIEIKKKIVSNINYSKMDSVPTKLDFIYRRGLTMISELEMKKKEYENFYLKNYEKEFNLFLKQVKAPDIMNIIQDFTDYSIIEYYFINSTNQLFSNVNHYINEINIIVKNLKEVLFEYIDLLKQAMEIYHNHLSKIFNMNLYKTFGNYEKFVENSSKQSIDLKLSIKKLLENNQDQNNLKEFNDLLLEYKNNLKNNPNTNDDLIKDDNNFLIEKYNSIEEFLKFLIQLIPKKIEINYNELIQYQKNCKRSAGMFKGFKNAFIVITLQGHILILDEDKEKNDNIISNKIFMIYNKSKVQIRKKESKKTNFLLSIWEIAHNKKKVKYLILDTLNEENLNEIIKNIGGLVEGIETEKSEEEEQEEKKKKNGVNED
jgi:hypothetical protein